MEIMGLLAVCAIAVVLALMWRRQVRRRRLAVRRRDRAARRRMLLSLVLVPYALEASAQTQGARRNTPEPKGPQALARVRLHNTGRAEQAPGFVTPTFGLPFAQGAMPQGQFPQFETADGKSCAATLWAVSRWPDGSMKFCAAMLRVPAGIARRDVLDIDVRSTTVKPGASKRSLAELWAAGLAVELTGIDGLEGVWLSGLDASLTQGGSRAAVVQLANGDAGAVWRIGVDFRDGSGAAHGQLYCWHYVAALQDEDGKLLGLRYLGRVAQPWTDVATPPPRHRDVKARLLAGKTTLRQLQGHVDSEKPGPAIRLPHYGSFFTAGEDARWNFVQANGSAETDSAVRVSIETAYWISTRLVPPFDSRVYIGSARDANYYPMGAGSVMRGMGTTGERADIGVMPEWNVCHLLTQAADHERLARVNAMAAGGWRLSMRKRATGQPVPCVGSRPHYAGLGNPERAWRGYLHMAGMVAPEPNNSLWHEDTSHRPGCVYWPYLFTGEPQYLDLMIEHGFAHVLELHAGTNTYATSAPARDVYVGGWQGGRNLRIGTDSRLYQGAGVLFNGSGGLRTPAWASRDVSQAAALSPEEAPDGVAVRDYLLDVIRECHAALAEYARRMPASFSRAGMFVMNKGNDSPWMTGYLSWSLCHQADVLATPEAGQAREYVSRLWRSFAAIADIGCLTGYRCNFWNEDHMAQRVDEAVGLRESTIEFRAGDSRGTIQSDTYGKAFAWSPTEGDVFVFGAPESSQLRPAPEVRPGQRLYAVNCQRSSFQLSTTRGGKPLAIPVDITIPSYMCRAKDLGPALGFKGGAHNYQSNICGAVSYHLARGDAVGDAKAALDAIVSIQGTRFDNQPKYLVR